MKTITVSIRIKHNYNNTTNSLQYQMLLSSSSGFRCSKFNRPYDTRVLIWEAITFVYYLA